MPQPEHIPILILGNTAEGFGVVWLVIPDQLSPVDYDWLMETLTRLRPRLVREEPVIVEAKEEARDE